MAEKNRDLEEARGLISHMDDEQKKKEDLDPVYCNCIPLSKVKSLLVCIFYASCAILLSLNNKLVLSSYNFNFPVCITLFQQLGAGLIISLLSMCGLVKVPSITQVIGKDSILVSLAFLSNTICGFAGLRLVDIPMFLTLRRLTTIFTLLGEYIFLHQYQSGSVVLSLAVIMIGAIIAGYSTLTNNIYGLLFTLGNDVLTALYLNFVARFSKNTGIRSYQLMYVNAMLSIPSLIIIAYFTGEFSTLMTFPHWSEFGFQIAIALTSFMGVVMVYSTILCSTYNSPVATSVTGNLKDLVLTVTGALIFKDHLSTMSIIGISVSFLGAYSYSYLKLKH